MDKALILCRWLHYGAAMILFGTAIFQSVMSPRRLAAALDARLRPFRMTAAAVALLTAVAWLFLLSGQLAGDWADVWTPATWYAVLSDTEFGSVWSFHLAVIVLLGVFLFRHGLWASYLSAFLAALFLASLGLIGHAALLDGPTGWLNRASQMAHLLAAGFWLGALIPLLICLGKLRDGQLRAEASTALRRFSGWGHIAVATVIATGLLNTWLVLGRWPFDFSSRYQRLLAIKIALVAVMVCLALVNRYVLVPKLRQDRTALKVFRTLTAAEIGLGIIVIALVSVFGTLMPR